ncbi:MAG: VirB8/TrbF family protein [Bryobacterales bacterium]|nr:VirB8/TrbF family protein [Bryobacterales bacterium]
MNDKNVREYAEAWAAHASAARTLRWIVGALILVLFITSIGWVRSASHEPQPLFVRVDDVGRAEVVNYEALQFDKDPLSPVTKFFLARFIRDHYERRRGGVREAWTRSLYFLTSELAQTASSSDSENIASVIAGQSSEIVMQDLTLRITPSEQPPFTAIATYTLIYQRRGTELGRELWSTELRFHFLDGVPSEYVLVNPIGLSISYLRSDRAVSES